MPQPHGHAAVPAAALLERLLVLAHQRLHRIRQPGLLRPGEGGAGLGIAVVLEQQPRQLQGNAGILRLGRLGGLHQAQRLRHVALLAGQQGLGHVRQGRPVALQQAVAADEFGQPLPLAGVDGDVDRRLQRLPGGRHRVYLALIQQRPRRGMQYQAIFRAGHALGRLARLLVQQKPGVLLIRPCRWHEQYQRQQHGPQVKTVQSLVRHHVSLAPPFPTKQPQHRRPRQHAQYRATKMEVGGTGLHFIQDLFAEFRH